MTRPTRRARDRRAVQPTRSRMWPMRSGASERSPSPVSAHHASPPPQAGEQRAEDRPLPQPLQRQRAAADADEHARHRQLLARAVPPAPVPDAAGGPMRRQVQSVRVGHARRPMQFLGQIVRAQLLIRIPTPDVLNVTAEDGDPGRSAVELPVGRRDPACFRLDRYGFPHGSGAQTSGTCVAFLGNSSTEDVGGS